MADIHDLVRALAGTAAVQRKLAGVVVKEQSAKLAHAGELCLRLATELPVMHDHELALQFQAKDFDQQQLREKVAMIGLDWFPMNARILLEDLISS